MKSFTDEELEALEPLLAKRSQLKAMRRLLDEPLAIEVTVRTKRGDNEKDLQFRLGIEEEASYDALRDAVGMQLDEWIARATRELREAGFAVEGDTVVATSENHLADKADIEA